MYICFNIETLTITLYTVTIIIGGYIAFDIVFQRYIPKCLLKMISSNNELSLLNLVAMIIYAMMAKHINGYSILNEKQNSLLYL